MRSIKVRAILFDIDGTLVDSNDMHVDARIEAQIDIAGLEAAAIQSSSIIAQTEVLIEAIWCGGSQRSL